MRRTLAMIAVVALASCSVSCSVNSSPPKGSSTLRLVPVSPIDINGSLNRAVSQTQAADPAGDGRATCQPVSIAMAGALTGSDATWGNSIRGAVKLAIDRHNQNNPRCQVGEKNFDTQDDPQKAVQVVNDIVDDKSIIGLLGPLFTDENMATGQILNNAGLVSVNSSATSASLSKNDWKTFFRGVPNDDVQGTAAGKYMLNAEKFHSVCVVADNSDYGVGLAKTVQQALGAANRPSCSAGIKQGDKDFSAVVSKIKAVNPDAVFFAGFYTEAALLASQIKNSGSKATFVSDDASASPVFVTQAGDAAKGAIMSSPCVPIPSQFSAEYEKHNGYAPALCSVEAYDLTTILLRGIDQGKQDRTDLLDFVRNYSGDGVARPYKWDTTGELTSPQIWMYQVK